MTDKKTKTDKNLAHNRFSRFGLLAFLVIFASVGGYILWTSLAAPNPPSVYLTQTTLVNGPNATFSVQLRENSGTTTVNAVQTNLSFPSSLLTLVSVDLTGSAFPTNPQSIIGGGSLTLVNAVACGTTCPAKTGDQLVATLNFKTTATGGTANVAFTTGTALLEATNSTNLLTNLSTMAVGGSYTTDTAPPTVSITSPANNATLAGGSTVNLTVNASDASSSVTKVEYYVDSVLKGTSSTSPFSYSWNTTGYTLANHLIQARAYDSFNNSATSTNVTVSLTDQSAPSAPTSFRSTSATLNSIALAWNASTDNVAVVNYKISRNGTLIATVNAPSLAYTDSGIASDTSYDYSIKAYDSAGNASTAATLTTRTQTPVQGDLDGDGHVSLADLTLLLNNFGTTNTAGDVDKNGVVDVYDLSKLIKNYGT